MFKAINKQTEFYIHATFVTKKKLRLTAICKIVGHFNMDMLLSISKEPKLFCLLILKQFVFCCIIHTNSNDLL